HKAGGRRIVPVVSVTTHREGLRDHGLERDTTATLLPRFLDCSFQHGTQATPHPLQPFDHILPVSSVPQDLPDSLVHVGVCPGAVLLIHELVEGHAGRDHPRHRTDGIVVMGAVQSDLAPLGHPLSLPRSFRPFLVERGPDYCPSQRTARPLPIYWGTGVEECPSLHRELLLCSTNVYPYRI